MSTQRGETTHRDRLRHWHADNRSAAIEGWCEFLRFPSVGTDPAHLDDCRACAAWLTAWLEARGFVVTARGAQGAPPVLVAGRPGEVRHAPSVMLYGHYDVQPADPLEAWISNPWAPEVRGDRMYARGAQDDKGQTWWSLQAIRACIETGTPLPDMKIVLDGQEESGSSELLRLIDACPDAFQSDILMVADTEMRDDGRPAITLGLRGVSCITFRLHGAAYDLHSGRHGGLAPNPAVELARIVASLHAADGSIAVQGLMEGAVEPSEVDLAVALSEPFDAEAYARETGVPAIGGAQGVDPRIRLSLLPTIEVNGFHSGYAGEGGKTIIPAWAEVKLSMRTVSGQAPETVLAAVRRHVEARVKPGMRLEIPFCEAGSSALRVAADAPAVRRAQAVLSALHPRGCTLCYEGASIHVIGALAAAAGADPVLVGFGLEADRIHAPNESFSFAQCALTFDYTSAFLSDVVKG